MVSNIIKLPEPDLNTESTTKKAFENRQSIRKISKNELDDQELSNILWAACGVNRADGKRTAPLLWDMHLYVALKTGVYEYDADNNSINLVIEEDIRSSIPQQGFAKEAPAILLLGLDTSEIDRGMYQLMESTGGIGFYLGAQTAYVSQNIYLYASANDLNTVALGMFDRELLKNKLKFTDTKNIYLVHPIGHPD